MSTEPTPAAPPGDPPAPGAAPAPRRRGRQTALDMVRSLVVILAFVGVVLLLAPQPEAVDQPQVSAAQAAVAHGQASDVLDGDPLLLVPGDRFAEAAGAAGVPPEALAVLGEDWRLDYTRTEETDDVDTWRVGVLSPQERRVDLEQAVAPGEEWLTRADAGAPGLPEPVEVGGLTWTVQQRGDGDTSYTWLDPAAGPGALTTAVSASSDSPDLREVVEAVSGSLRPAA